MENHVVKSGDKPFLLNLNHPWLKQCTHFQLNREFYKFAGAAGTLAARLLFTAVESHYSSRLARTTSTRVASRSIEMGCIEAVIFYNRAKAVVSVAP